jgi:hypothetical protein
MKSRKLLFSSVIGASICLFSVAHVGYVTTYLDDETQTTFFIKRFPTFKAQFFDPFANEADPPPVGELSANNRKSFADYCKYRFGITSDDTNSLIKCQSKIPSYLKNFHL